MLCHGYFSNVAVPSASHSKRHNQIVPREKDTVAMQSIYLIRGYECVCHFNYLLSKHATVLICMPLFSALLMWLLLVVVEFCFPVCRPCI